MGLILWPAAMLVLLMWSLAAWLVYGLSESAAALLASALSGVLTAELGPWAAWLIGSLGTLIKFGVVAVWAIGGFAILGAPLWLNRKRRAGAIPDSYRQRDYFGGRPNDGRYSYQRGDDSGFDRSGQRYERPDRPAYDHRDWRARANQGYGEISFLRDAARDMMGKYRYKRKKKKRDDDDDD